MRKKKLLAWVVSTSMMISSFGSVFAIAQTEPTNYLLIATKPTNTVSLTEDMVNKNGILVIEQEMVDSIVIPKELKAKKIVFKGIQANQILLESGADYIVEIQDSEVAKISVLEPTLEVMDSKKISQMLQDGMDASEVVQLYREYLVQKQNFSKRYPKLVTKGTTTVDSIVVSSNVQLDLKQGQVEDVTIDCNGSENWVKVEVSKYNGTVNINQSFNKTKKNLLRVDLKDSQLEELNISSEKGTKCSINSDKLSRVNIVEVDGNASVNLSVETEKVHLNENVKDAFISIYSAVNDIVVKGDNNEIRIGNSAKVNSAIIEGNDVAIYGNGTLGSANIIGKEANISVRGTDVEGENDSTLPSFMITPEPTSRPEPTATSTPTPEPTATNTPTPEPTATNTPTPEPTATNTPTPEPTATNTPTPEPTATNTPTPKPTATNTPTPKPTATNTPTPEPTATNTPTPEPTATNTPTPIEQCGVNTAYHTKEEVKNYMAESGADATLSKTTTVSDISFASPYKAGIVSKEYLNDALNMLNQIRYIAGLSNTVSLNDSYTELVQVGSFLNAVNNQLSHYPEQPDDMDDELYEKGYTGASSANIAMSTGDLTISRSVLLWMDDSDAYNIDRLGHRRWILNPGMQQTGFGYAKNSSGATYTSMYSFDNAFSSMGIQGVAWPAREMPLRYFGNNMAWSYSYGESLSNIEVKLSCITEGKQQVWNFSESSSDGYFNVENSNYGQKGCVIFRPNNISISDGDSYVVTITQEGELLAQYVVNFFE